MSDLDGAMKRVEKLAKKQTAHVRAKDQTHPERLIATAQRLQTELIEPQALICLQGIAKALRMPGCPNAELRDLEKRYRKIISDLAEERERPKNKRAGSRERRALLRDEWHSIERDRNALANRKPPWDILEISEM